ncbi:MAG: lysylphosphatidylglycerol synthase transmembrane domain-containing protein [Terriglobia bacterium]
MSHLRRQNTALMESPSAGPSEPARLAAPPKKRRWLRDILAYALATAIIVYLARGTSLNQFASILRQANPWWFLLACAGSFAVWFFGETYLYAKLFSYFHVPTSFREMLPANAAQYFLQAINQVAGGAALVLFMRRRKGVPIFAGGASLVFLGLVDVWLMSAAGLAAALLVPSSWLGPRWYCPAILTAGIGLVVWFWLRGRPRSRVLRWIYDRPSLLSFRQARPSHYLLLMLIRTPIFAAQAFALYFQLLSFGVHVPLIQVLAFEPAELFLSALPITPAGLGVLQAVLVLGFNAYGTRAAILTAGLAISMVGILMRLPLGLGAAGSLAREIRDHPQPHAEVEPQPVAVAE